LLWGYRRSPRHFAQLGLGVVGALLTLDLYLGLSRSVKFDPHEYFGSDTNALPLLVGCLLAIAVHHQWMTRSLAHLASCALPAAALLPVLAERNDTHRVALVTVAGTALTLVLLAGVLTRSRSWVGSLMSLKVMRWLGERSYSIYLWNVLVRAAILNVLGHTLVGDILWVTLVLVLAEASFRYVERPMRARLAHPRASLTHCALPA
jgi:peptidoglycan/LPS O-acetylase OafA/YrhL